jgi:CBS domain-containing protein
MSVGRICVREVDTATFDESAEIAAERMHQRAVGTLVLVNDAAQPIGIVTDRDLVTRVLARGRNASETLLRDVMTAAPRTMMENDSIEAALSLMRRGNFRRVPVVDKNKKLVGLVTLDDILILLAEEFGDIGRLLEHETPRAVAEV